MVWTICIIGFVLQIFVAFWHFRRLNKIGVYGNAGGPTALAIGLIFAIGAVSIALQTLVD